MSIFSICRQKWCILCYQSLQWELIVEHSWQPCYVSMGEHKMPCKTEQHKTTQRQHDKCLNDSSDIIRSTATRDAGRRTSYPVLSDWCSNNTFNFCSISQIFPESLHVTSGPPEVNRVITVVHPNASKHWRKRKEEIHLCQHSTKHDTPTEGRLSTQSITLHNVQSNWNRHLPLK